MAEKDKRGEDFLIVETLLIPVPNDMGCVFCPDIIPKGEEAFQSPSTPNRFYHQSCMRDLVRSAGKDPDKFIRIITPESTRDN